VQPPTVIHANELQALRNEWTTQRVAFVPTMGALHDGHVSLVKEARKRADRVVVSIFVNPTQFGPTEDFDKYPRTLKADLEALAPHGVDGVFLPNATTMYPEGYETYVHSKGMAKTLDGLSRPGHFEGVLTVVLKLFNLVRPHVAIFGKKDYQQWRVITKMVEDLNVPVEVVGAETLREPDGLAMSSRNRYLTPDDRKKAACLSQGLKAAQIMVKTGQKQTAAVTEAFMKCVRPIEGVALEYAEIRRQRNLEPFGAVIDAPAVMLAEAKLGSTRLIDNMELG